MSDKNGAKVIEKLEAELKKLKNKEFKACFFVIDSKGNPSGSLAYIYETAYHLKELGYNVLMLHQEKEFVGVGEWLGERYSSLPHACIEKDNIPISPSDFLFIPELFSNIMNQTKKLPCKRVAILQNINYVTEIIPPGLKWEDYGVYDVITTSASLEKMVKDIFPSIRTNIVRPSISPLFRPSDEPKKPIVNIVTRDSHDANRIVKPFFWKYPQYKWVSFRELRGLSRNDFANSLRESLATVWVDTPTNFGYTALEAIKSGNIVIGKIPDEIPEWMLENGNTVDGDFKNNGIWFDNMRDVHRLIKGVVEAYIYDEIPKMLTDGIDSMQNAFNVIEQNSDIERVYKGLFDQREKELTIALTQLKNNLEKK